MQGLRRASTLGPAVLCHVDGSQRKLIRNARRLRCARAWRGWIYRRGSAVSPQDAHKPQEEPAHECGQSWARIRRRSSTSVRRAGRFQIDPTDPAAPDVLGCWRKMRSPVTLRDLMIHRSAPAISARSSHSTAAELPKSAAELYPEIGVSEVAVPSPAGRIRCQVFRPPASGSGRRAPDDALPARRRLHRSANRRTPPTSRAGSRRKTRWWW